MVDKKTLTVYERPSTAGLNRPQKMVKLVVPRCRVCNVQGQGKRGWWESCKHDPYFTVTETTIARPQLETQPDGRVLKVGEEVEVEYHRDPNMKQVADDLKAASGRMVQIQIERGAKYPEELGYAPICDYRNCWEPNPTIHTQRGHYHTRDEAAIIILRDTETPIYLGLDKDIERRREQLDRVNVR